MPRHKLPTLLLEQFFTGKVKGWGSTVSWLGSIQNQFTIDAEGVWDPQSATLKLVERYNFDDGHKDTLNWKIRKLSDGRYEGQETDLKGLAKGRQDGNMFVWKYRRNTPRAGGRKPLVRFRDQFFFATPNLLMATASVSKFGIGLATITVAYEKSA